MLKTWQFVVLMAMAVLSAVLVVANMVLFTQNRGLQQTIAARQQFVQQTAQLEPLYQQIVKALAELASRNNDAQLAAVLNSQGITFTRNPTSSTAASQPPAPVKR